MALGAEGSSPWRPGAIIGTALLLGMAIPNLIELPIVALAIPHGGDIPPALSLFIGLFGLLGFPLEFLYCYVIVCIFLKLKK